MRDLLEALTAGISLPEVLLLWLVVVLAAVLRAFTGFGFALAAMPVFALVMPPTEAVVLSASLTLAVNLLTVKSYWGVFPLRPLMPMLLLAGLGTWVGANLLERFSPAQFRFWIGAAVIAACALLAFYRPRHHRHGPWLGGLTGMASGLLNGAFAIPGPPVIVYAMAAEPQPARSRALLMTFFLGAALMALAAYASAGFVTTRAPWLFLLAFPAMFLGDKLGFWLFDRYGGRLYRRVALLVLFAIGASIMFA